MTMSMTINDHSSSQLTLYKYLTCPMASRSRWVIPHGAVLCCAVLCRVMCSVSRELRYVLRVSCVCGVRCVYVVCTLCI